MDSDPLKVSNNALLLLSHLLHFVSISLELLPGPLILVKLAPITFGDFLFLNTSDCFTFLEASLKNFDLLMQVVCDAQLVVEGVTCGLESLNLDILVLRHELLVVKLFGECHLTLLALFFR